MSPQEQLYLMQTVECMHNVGVAHMDLTTSNILVQSATRVPSLKIIDFGLSRQIATGNRAACCTSSRVVAESHHMQLYAACHALCFLPFIMHP